MKYIVKTKGKVYDYKQIAYAVEAESREEAEQAARERFCADYIPADEVIEASASGVKIGTMAALVTLAAAAVLAFIGFKTGTTRSASVIRPDLMSLVYGAGVYLILFIKFKGFKNLLNMKWWAEVLKSWENIVLAVLMIILIASLIQLMFSQMKVGFSFLSFHMDMRVLALVLAAVAYFGSGILSLICLLLFLLLSKMSLSGLAAVLGNIRGFLYLGCALIGVITYMSTQPALYQSIMNVKAKISDPAKKLRKEQTETV